MTLSPRPLAAYELLPLPTLERAELDAIVAHHGWALDGPIVQLPSSGVVHSLWALGSQWVLRVPKNEALCIGDHRCEAAAIPIARDAGVTTPDLVVFDNSCSILDVPFSIVDRVDGTDLVAAPSADGVYEKLGFELAVLHAAGVPVEPHPWLRDTRDLAAEAHFDDVVEAGLLHEDAVTWLRHLCARLDSIIEAGPPPPQAFIHDDVKPDNVMVDRAGTVFLIDWGDAGVGDPAHDFQSLPMAAADLAMTGYRAVRGSDADPTLEARVVRRVVARSLSNLRRTPLVGPGWHRPIAATLTDLLTFAVDRPNRWRAWTQPG